MLVSILFTIHVRMFNYICFQGALSIPPPPPPNINPSGGRNQSHGPREAHQVASRPNPTEHRRGSSLHQGGQRGRGRVSVDSRV